jgi:hypothetical protein
MKNRLYILILGVATVITPDLSAGEHPIRFTENKGQIADQYSKPRPDVLFVTGAGPFTTHFMKTGFSYQLVQAREMQSTPLTTFQNDKFKRDLNLTLSFYRLDMHWIGASEDVQIVKDGELAGCDNYYSEVCPQGVTGVKSFSSITYKDLYRGVDLKWYEKEGQLKYDYIVKAGADYKMIQWELKGADYIKINSVGQLIIQTPQGVLIEEAPLVLQDQKRLTSKWQLDDNRLSFEIFGADKTKELIIDPLVRLWGTYYGGNLYDDFSYCHVDKFNNVYFSGTTASNAALTIATVGSHQSTFGGGNAAFGPYDAYIVKMNANGVRQWATYYGGSGTDVGNGLASDGNGNIYMVGPTTTSNSAVMSTGGAHQATLNTAVSYTNADAFIVKFDLNGVRLWGSYYGDVEDDWGSSVCVDKNNDVYFCGNARSGPTTGTVFATPGAHQTQPGAGTQQGDAFLAKFNSNGQRLWGTYYGGDGWENGYDCIADTLGNIYLTGPTNSTLSLVIATPGSHQSALAGMADAFLVKFNGTGTRLWGTYYGSTWDDYPSSMDVDAFNNVVMFGTTASFIGTVLATPGAHQQTYGGGNSDGFIARFSPSGVRRWGTYYGGAGFEESGAGCVSKTGAIFTCGRTSIGSGTAIATCGAYQFVHGGGVNDCFFARFDSTGVRQWGSFFGGAGDENRWSGLAADNNNNLYLGGMAAPQTSSAVISTSGAHQTVYGGGTYDAFLQKFDACLPGAPTVNPGASGCLGQSAVLMFNPNCGAKWYSDAALTNLLLNGGSYTTAPLSGDTTFYFTEGSCGLTVKAASIHLSPVPGPTVTIAASKNPVCIGENVQLTPSGASTYTWIATSAQNPLVISPTTNSTYSVVGSSLNGCSDTATFLIQVAGCVGMENYFENETIEFYPNPVSGKAFLKVPPASAFSLYGVKGDVIWKEKEIEKNQTMDFSELPAGIYFGRIKTLEETQVIKIVVPVR